MNANMNSVTITARIQPPSGVACGFINKKRATLSKSKSSLLRQLSSQVRRPLDRFAGSPGRERAESRLPRGECAGAIQLGKDSRTDPLRQHFSGIALYESNPLNTRRVLSGSGIISGPTLWKLAAISWYVR